MLRRTGMSSVVISWEWVLGSTIAVDHKIIEVAEGILKLILYITKC